MGERPREGEALRGGEERSPLPRVPVLNPHPGFRNGTPPFPHGAQIAELAYLRAQRRRVWAGTQSPFSGPDAMPCATMCRLPPAA